MALTDAKIRAAKPDVKSYKLTDGAGGDAANLLI
ncbi:hypothetical protein FGAF1053_07660 [Escherichia coli]|nr:hypothetical protein FGAF1053_07660 [Escherichia coli]